MFRKKYTMRYRPVAIEIGGEREQPVSAATLVTGSFPASIHVCMYKFCCMEQEPCLSDKPNAGLQSSHNKKSGGRRFRAGAAAPHYGTPGSSSFLHHQP